MKLPKAAAIAFAAATTVAVLPLFTGHAGAKPPTQAGQDDCGLMGGEWEDLWYLPGYGHITGECVLVNGDGSYSVHTWGGGLETEVCTYVPDGPDVDDEIVICN